MKLALVLMLMIGGLAAIIFFGPAFRPNVTVVCPDDNGYLRLCDKAR